ncbi:uncharacterized protein K441DRAFT_538552, partial [Cenococcum geophilum 1.58]|uniref:uncharacterized protein n=1 Tax=Cenococcum geophilum 1.58 TaxID=794803 RepID=UPI0035901E12
GRRLPDKVVHKIRLRIKANKDIATITAAVKVAKRTIYKMRLNLNIWGKPYAPSIVVLGQPRALLPYQEIRLFNFLKGQPTAYLDKMQAFLFSKFNA